MNSQLQQILAQFEDKTPEQAASMLITHFKGDRRAAEAEAWKIWAALAGGEIGRRPKAESKEAKYLVYVTMALSDRRESPPVPDAVKPAGAFAAPFLTQKAA